MVIQEVSITNFRGVNGKREFVFDAKPFVLLSAPNGLGKTTIIDAIEWALTGNIGRLNHAYNERSTNDSEREANKKGILINKHAGNPAKVTVELKILSNEKVHYIRREQNKDELKASSSTVWFDNSKELAKKELINIVGESFYNYHFCDIQKSFSIQNSKRNKLPELFTEFISDYTKELIIAENLEYFAEDINRYKDDLENIKIAQSTIEMLQKDLQNYSELPVVHEYPETRLYDSENLLVMELDTISLKQQLEQIYKCGYEKVDAILNDVLENEIKLGRIERLNKLHKNIEQNKELIDKAFLVGLDKDRQSLLNINERIRQYSDINLTSKNLDKYASVIFSIKDTRFSEENYKHINDKIKRLNEENKKVEEEIKKLTKGNEIIDALSSLVSKSVGIKKYRFEEFKEKGKANCPVCGSDIFGKIDDTEILKEANIYVDSNGKVIAEKKILLDENEKLIKEFYNNLLLSANSVIKNIKEKLNAEKERLEELDKETKLFFEIAKELEQIDTSLYSLNKMCSIEYVESCIINLKNSCLLENDLVEKRSEYINILNLLGLKMDIEESEKSIALRVKEQAKISPGCTNFSLELLTKKINSLKSILDNQDYQNKRKNLDDAINKNKEILIQQEILGNTKEKAQIKVQTIRGLVEKLKADEYQNVGPTLNKFYKKLSRINSIEDIEVILEDDQLSLIDEKENNIVNVLSNGQLSIFMLAYFFAGIYTRSKNEKCKVYFIDDLTACLDDINMLAFLDLLKYQMLSKDGAIDQLFFVSCDTDICKLLKYKLEGSGIDYRELTEADFV